MLMISGMIKPSAYPAIIQIYSKPKISCFGAIPQNTNNPKYRQFAELCCTYDNCKPALSPLYFSRIHPYLEIPCLLLSFLSLARSLPNTGSLQSFVVPTTIASLPLAPYTSLESIRIWKYHAFIFGAVVIGSGAMLAPAWPSKQPRIGLNAALALDDQALSLSSHHSDLF